MKELTKAEEQIMQILWEIKKGFIKDIADKFPDPKPANTTISTVVKILETKGFIEHNVYGKIHEYYPVISKEEYTRAFMGNVVKNYFSNSYHKMVSFFARDKEVSIEDMEQMMNILKEEMRKKRESS
ncbi:MAG TPA: BlaI/MecI/CopY family transcriptional regulator [Bacteroidales bacterium]|nr:BlaI/MecI/CopY family transcriptional regulator [Bacteroidales bacterium]